MKVMTCNQLGGACDLEFKGETFEEIAEQSKNHGMEMFNLQDSAHLQAMEKMKQLSQEEFKDWYAERQSLFTSLPTLVE